MNIATPLAWNCFVSPLDGIARLLSFVMPYIQLAVPHFLRSSSLAAQGIMALVWLGL
jgi:hypothetical protein